MPYKLSSVELANYIYERVYDPKFRGQRSVEISISEDSKSLVLTAPKGNKVIFTPYFVEGRVTAEGRATYDRIEIGIEPDKAGINSKDITGFLEKLVKDDIIFNTGQPLFSYERQEALPAWREVLERANKTKKGKMICLIKDTNVSTERLRKIVYEYMFRPCLYYLFNLGSFTDNNKKKSNSK